MTTRFDQYIDVLTRFANSHNSGDSDTDSLIQLKLDHSVRVFENAAAIIEGEGLSGPAADNACLAAIFHDIGRFPQLARYRTFNDRESINHGRLGVQTMRSLPLPCADEARWKVVRVAIGQHNIKSIRSSLPEPYATPARIVRDADKIDICRVMIDNFTGDCPDPVVTHGVADVPDTYSEELYHAVMNEEPGDYAQIRYTNDFKLLVVGWLYHLHYTSSAHILFERGYVERIFSLLPKDERIKDLESKIYAFSRYNNQ